MSFPAPKPGLVIRYSFLWSDEAEAGADEASKDRPCAIVVAVPRAHSGALTVIVSPITHAPPKDGDSIELPIRAARALGLDGERHWIRTDELNRFTWPGYDLRTIPGRPGEYAYGMLPQPLYEELRRAILARQKRASLKAAVRD